MILLLTGCINPNGMSLTVLNNPKERQMQYEKAIQYYLLNTSYPIVFVENSGTNISSSFQDYIASGRIECLTFPKIRQPFVIIALSTTAPSAIY